MSGDSFVSFWESDDFSFFLFPVLHDYAESREQDNWGYLPVPISSDLLQVASEMKCANEFEFDSSQSVACFGNRNRVSSVIDSAVHSFTL